MLWLEKLRFIVQISRSQDVMRRYFVVNSFDGALTLLGLNTGFYISGEVELSVAIAACIGTSVALGMSGFSSAYLSEAAERRHRLIELEKAMITDLDRSIQYTAAQVTPLLIALVNGLSPFSFALLIIAPLWLAQAGLPMPYSPMVMAILVALAEIFFLGMFLAQVGSSSPLGSGVKAILIAALTMLLILQLGG